MRRGLILIFVVLIVVVALIVGYVVFRQLLPQTTQQATPTNVDVYVAGQNIPQGGKITGDVLTTKTLPQTMVTADMYTTANQADLLNNKIASIPLSQGTFITKGEVTDASQAVAIPGPAWATVIPPGMVAKSIPTTRFSLSAYGVADGAHVNLNVCIAFVDLDAGFQTESPNHTAVINGTGVLPNSLPVLTLGVTNIVPENSAQPRIELEPSFQQPYAVQPSEPQRPRVVCQAFLQDVVVMKVGNFPLVSASQTTAQQQAQQQQTAPTTAAAPDLVTLIVSPQDAIALDYWVYTDAQITMALRNPNDQSRQATNPMTLQFALSQYNIPVPAKLPYGTQPSIGTLTQPVLPNDLPSAPSK